MKKRVLSALLVLCMACGMVSTVWANDDAAAVPTPSPTAETTLVEVDPATPEVEDDAGVPAGDEDANSGAAADGTAASQTTGGAEEADVDQPESTETQDDTDSDSVMVGNGESGVEQPVSIEDDTVSEPVQDSIVTYQANAPQPRATVAVENRIKNTGRLVATVSGAGEGELTYTWYRSADGAAAVEVQPVKVTGDDYNAQDNWLNVALDIESLCEGKTTAEKNAIRSQTYSYYVVVKQGETEVVRSDAYQVPYYAQLLNGDFEAGDAHWATTASTDTTIEIGSYSQEMYVYGTTNDRPVTGGDTNFAELNAGEAASLYQDVLTVPGTELTWQLAHRARNAKAQNWEKDNFIEDATDTMYVVIMSESDAEALLNDAANRGVNQQTLLSDMISEVLPNGGSVQDAKYQLSDQETTVTVAVTEVTTASHIDFVRRDWVWNGLYYKYTYSSSGQWGVYGDSYKVPAGQYATRFFFVAGNTQTNDVTVGNLIDDVWFSPELPPANPDQVTITGTKTVTIDELPSDYSVTIKLSGSNNYTASQTIQLTKNGNGTYSGTYAFTNISIAANSTPTFTVTEEVTGEPSTELYEISNGGTVTSTNGTTETFTGMTKTIEVSRGNTYTVNFNNTYIPKTTTLTLKKTFAGLSNEEVYYLLFGQSEATEGEAYWDANFSFDVNYCDLEHTDDDGGLKYMAFEEDIPDAVAVPGTSTKVQNGGALKVYAARLLTKPASAEQLGDARAATVTPASLTQNSTTGDWTFETTITVPTCTNANNFITVYEQHGEVPGYAKLGTASTRYTVSLNGATEGQDGYWTGNGKFVCESGKQLEDMKGENDAYWIDGEGEGDQKVGFARLAVTAPTTISFTNHYTGKLNVTKVIGGVNEYTGAEAKTYTLTLEPAHPTKLDLKSDDGAQHGLSGKTVHYYTTDSNSTTPLTIDQNGKISIPNVSVNTVIHFIDLPAIQWQVGEDTDSAAVTGYQLTQSVTDENNDVVGDATHWNEYAANETIGGTLPSDGIVSVDSALDSVAVAKATVTNEYTRQTQTLTVRKIVSGGMGSNTDDFNFTITLVDTTMGTAPNYEPYDFTNVPPRLTQKTDEFDNKISGSYEFTLSGGEIIEIQLPYGVQATVTEDLDSTSGYKVASRQYTNNDLSEEDFETKHPFVENDADQNVTIGVYNLYIDFKNTRTAVAPTGLESNHTTPYVLMITAAGMAGLALIGGIVARRIRRRRQE